MHVQQMATTILDNRNIVLFITVKSSYSAVRNCIVLFVTVKSSESAVRNCEVRIVLFVAVKVHIVLFRSVKI